MRTLKYKGSAESGQTVEFDGEKWVPSTPEGGGSGASGASRSPLVSNRLMAVGG